MKKISKRRLEKAIVMTFLAVGVQSVASAMGVGDVEIHGYGNQNYLQTNDNSYLGANENGSWDNISLATIIVAKVHEKSKIWTQFHSDGKNVRLDWSFVDYQVNNDLLVRSGMIKVPMGIYNDILNAQFLQVTSMLPAMYQGGASMVPEAYRGAALLYEYDVGAGRLSVDAYTGSVTTPDEPETLKNHRLLGGRVTYKTPISGLTFMASGYRSIQDDTSSPTDPLPSPTAGKEAAKLASILSVDYVNHNLDIKAEYANLANGLENTRSSSYYVQAGYSLTEKWSPYVRYDYITTDTSKSNDASSYQRTATIGIGYRVSNSVGLRLENNFNNGYALPVSSGEVDAGAGATNWNMTAVSVNFIF